jgi:hypothetical protein
LRFFAGFDLLLGFPARHVTRFRCGFFTFPFDLCFELILRRNGIPSDSAFLGAFLNDACQFVAVGACRP